MSRINDDVHHLAKLQDYYARHGVLPSYAGISELVGFRAKTAAVKLAGRLSRAGYVRLAPHGKLAPDAKFFQRPLAASAVRAGVPDIAEESFFQPLSIDRYLIDKPSQTVIIRVKGESMKGVGINDGDIAVVERRDRAEKGDFVVALVNGEFTLKEYGFDGREPVLRPHNDAFDVIKVSRDVQVFGVVVGLIRRYAQMRSRKSQRQTGG